MRRKRGKDLEQRRAEEALARKHRGAASRATITRSRLKAKTLAGWLRRRLRWMGGR